jgi:hypothetical protein
VKGGRAVWQLMLYNAAKIEGRGEVAIEVDAENPAFVTG